MAELTTQERLQPSLLDRLTDAARFKERVALRIREDVLAKHGLGVGLLRQILDAHDLHPVEERTSDRREAGQDAPVEVYESGPGVRALGRALEQPVGTGSGGAVLRDLVEVVDRHLLPNTAESRRDRVISGRQLKDSVLRDLAWLMNTGNLAAVQDLSAFPRVQGSVLNYGIPDLAGITASSADVDAVAAGIRRCIEAFEPRLRRVVVRPTDADPGGRNALSFVIEAELWGQPMSEHLYLHTEMDLESADVTVREASA